MRYLAEVTQDEGSALCRGAPISGLSLRTGHRCTSCEGGIITHPENGKLVIRQIEWETRKVSASVVIGGEEHHVWVSASEDLCREMDFLLPAVLLPAMKAGVTLEMPGEASPRLLSSASQIQDIYSMWESAFGRVPVDARPRAGTVGEPSGVACFFSGGVDSFYTLLKHRDEVSHLIHIRPSRDIPRWERTSQEVRGVARELHKTLIELETNLDAFSRSVGISWKYYHGAWMVSAALLFQHVFRKVLIAGSTTSNYDNPRPQGTHPVLDPLWGTERTGFYHDGCEMRRIEKVAYISGHEAAMKRLQVCGTSTSEYNCGRCEKCLRTMLSLKAAGALERCETLPDDLDLEAVAAMDLSSYSASYFARENLGALERLGTERQVVRALTEALDKGSQAIAHSGYAEEDASRLLAKQQTSRRKIKKLREMNRKLREENAKLTASRSTQRRKVMDTMARISSQIPGVGRLLRKSHK